jgi:Carboxypeptidase regulatory-like domain
MQDPVRRRRFKKLATGLALQLLAVATLGTMVVVAQAAASTKPACSPVSGPASPPASPQATVPCGSISGTVTDTGNHPLPGICVSASAVTFPGSYGSDRTDAAGNYLITNLTPASYKVSFYDCATRTHVQQWYNNKPDSTSADVVVVTDGNDTPNINAALASGGSISGVVTDAGATPLFGICVYAYGQSSPFYGFAQTKHNGAYTIAGLSPGTYNVEFYDCQNGRYVDQWYNNKPSFDTADPVVVTDGANTPNINAALIVAGSISGTVTDAGAHPLAGICVSVVDTSTGVFFGYAQTDPSGQYLVSSLAPGTYAVQFYDCTQNIYVTQWFNNKPSQAAANPVTVTSGIETAGVNAALVKGGTISGTVTDTALQPLGAVCVMAEDPVSGIVVSSTKTKADGNYIVSGLATGNYKIEFNDCVATTHATQWAINKASFAQASLIQAKAGLNHAGVNAKLKDAT